MLFDNCVQSREWRWAFTDFSSASAFSSIIPTVTEPATDKDSGIYDLFESDLSIATMAGMVPTHIIVTPVLTDGDGDIGTFRVWGYRKLDDGDAWIPVKLAEVACTAGNIDASALVSGGVMCDTLSLTDGQDTHAGTLVVSPEDDTTGHALIALKGCRHLRFETDLGAGAVSMNLLWAPMNMPT